VGHRTGAYLPERATCTFPLSCIQAVCYVCVQTGGWYRDLIDVDVF